VHIFAHKLTHVCKNNNQVTNFRGGMNSICAIGYKGRMCNKCEEDEIDGAYYARSGPYNCTKCSPLAL